MKDKELAIVVVGFDGYSSLWNDFFSLLKKNWSDCPFNVYLITNQKDFVSDNVNVIKTYENAEWSSKIITALEIIKEKYICLLLEDFFISDKVENSKLFELLKLMEDYQIRYVKMPYKGQFNRMNRKAFNKMKGVYYIYQDEEYGVTLLPSIWQKDFLKDKVGTGNYSPWQFEIDRIKESKNALHTPYTDCIEINSNPLNILNGVVQGKFLPPTVKALKKKNHILNTKDFGVMKYSKYMFLRLKTYGLFYLPKRLHNPIKKILKCMGMKVTFIREERNER